MSTNYFVQPNPCLNPCEHCGLEPVHVGKNRTSFRAYPGGVAQWRTPILTWRDWERFLLAECGKVTDEYGAVSR